MGGTHSRRAGAGRGSSLAGCGGRRCESGKMPVKKPAKKPTESKTDAPAKPAKNPDNDGGGG